MELFPLTEDEIKKVRDVNNVTEESIRKDIEILKEWLKKQPHLPQKLPYDNFLEKILLNRKFNVERSKETIENLFTLKTFYKDVLEYFINFDYSLINNCACKAGFLKKLGPNNERIVVVQFRPNSPVDGAIATVLLLGGLYLYFKNDYSNGIIFIEDLKNCTFDYIQSVPIHVTYKIIQLIMNGFGVKINGIHVFNMKSYIQFIFKYVTAIKPKIGKKILFHKNVDAILQHLPLEYLPVDMGGSNGKIDELTEEFYSSLIQSKEELIKFAQITTNESLRIGEYLKPNELFGCEGTFKQLNLD